MADIDVLVLGAGVVGLAVGRAIAQSGRVTFIAERHRSFGTETSARNSEVIHAGIYYPRSSLKARFCVAGRKQLYAYCQKHAVPHRKCGKLIVATTAREQQQLKAIQDTASANGVDLKLKTGAQAMAMEPALKAAGALWSPETGIVDSHALMLQYLADFEAAGGVLALESKVGHICYDAPDWAVTLGKESVTARWVINCSGLHASDVARQVEGINVSAIPQTYYARGLYARALPSPRFDRLIYPVPVPGGLGIHATIDLAGSVRFGPDVEWIDSLDYTANAARLDGFREAIARYCPSVANAEMSVDYTGIRPKISKPNEPAADFRISGPGDMGVPNQIHLFGIESPGLTSSLAIGDYVAGLLKS
jgi:L-2-hydroxyglutarate oxidase LhgO